MALKFYKTNLLLLLCFFVFNLTSCSVQEDYKKSEKELSNNLLSNNLLINNFDTNKLNVSQTFKNTIFLFEVNKVDNIINSHFTVTTLDNKVIYETKYNLNSTPENYKLYQTERVLDIANGINYNFKDNTYAEIEYNMHVFFLNIFNEFRDKNISPLLNLLYFHNSIISIKKRSKETNVIDCECTLHPGYLLDKTGFICQEDFYIPIDILKDLVANSNDVILNFETN